MQIRINTDNHIQGSADLTSHVEQVVSTTLERFGRQITRVEVQLSDINGQKSRGNDKRCLMEARPAGLQPIAVSHVAATVHSAIDGAVERLERALEKSFGRLNDLKSRGAGESELSDETPSS
jgi:ribosome-associated translation inhibitor RaiA